MPLSINRYPQSLTSLWLQVSQSVQTPMLALALLNGAVGFDMARAADLGLNFRYKGLTRDPQNPEDFEDSKIAGMDWADDPIRRLGMGETWNRGRRATLTGERYRLDADGRPVNPYMNTGLTGRGVLGQFGPNHAVDNGVVVLDDNGLSILGITRKYDNDAPAMAGGFAKFSRTQDGQYRFDRAAQIKTRTEEFFEEMISGSVDLLPEYQNRLESLIDAHVRGILAKRADGTMDDQQRAAIAEEVATELKLEQVQAIDPGFMDCLENHIGKGVESFAGPVLCDGRNTNTAWIESRVTCVAFNDAIWSGIKGKRPPFDYRLAGGDDASSVVYHKVGAPLIENAYASHGAMIAFTLATYLLQTQARGEILPDHAMAQIEDVAAFLKPYRR